MNTIYDIELDDIHFNKTTLKPYKNKVLLIVNVASKCGFTKQYKDLEELYQKYKDKGFAILGFPCNQFLRQEPKDEPEIEKFAKECFLVSFPLFAKCNVKGKNQSELYKYIQNNLQTKPLKFMPWNFTKILINKSGEVLKQYPPTTSFKTITKDIEDLLGE